MSEATGAVNGIAEARWRLQQADVVLVGVQHRAVICSCLPQDSTNSGDNVKRLDQDSQQQMQEIKKHIASHKQKVLDTLLGYVTKIKISETSA